MAERSPQRRVAGLYVYYAFGYGGPVAVVGIGLIWLGIDGYPALWWIGGLMLAVGLRGVDASVRGGVRLTDSCVVTRGWRRRTAVQRDSVTSVRVRRVWQGVPDGWLLTIDGRSLRLSGLTVRHTHAAGPASCVACRESMTQLEGLAEDLGVPLVDEEKQASKGPQPF